ncbi:hypothetical protein Tco_1454363, partial [Tanacetum coccineum]
ALKLNKKELMGRSVGLELAKERGAFTPGSRNEKPYKKAQGTVFVPGFDTKGGLDNVKNALEKHIGNSLELDQSKVGGKLINVEEARPRDDSSGPRRTPESVRKEGPGKRARPGSDNRSHEPRRPFGPIRPRGPSKPSITTHAKGMLHAFFHRSENLDPYIGRWVNFGYT